MTIVVAAVIGGGVHLAWEAFTEGSPAVTAGGSEASGPRAGNEAPRPRAGNAAVGSGSDTSGSSQRPPNIVFILIDDMGWRDVGFMGSEYYETPNIDRLAAEGMVFTNAYANGPNCAPTRASLMSGQYTPRHGIYTVAPAARGDTKNRRLLVEETETTLDLEVVTIAEALQTVGYATASVGKWHLGGPGHLPTEQGFDVNIGGNARGAPASYFWPYERETAQGNVVRIPGLRAGGEEGEYLTDRLTDEALAWMEKNADRPFFLYLTHYAVHTPIQAKEQLAEKYRAKAGSNGQQNPGYAAMIESVDESVGRIVHKLDELGVADNTVVFFFSDNGGVGTITSMAPLRGMKGMLYEGGIREPLIVRWPGHTESGSSADTPVIGVDFYPTFLELAGAGRPDQVLDGLSMVPLLDAGAAAMVPLLAAVAARAGADLSGRAAELAAFAERPLFWHFPAYLEGNRNTDGPWRTSPVGAVRQGDYKLIEFFESGTLELYDLGEDLGEANDLAAEMPAKVEELHALMRSWRESVGAYVPTELNPDFDPGDRRGESTDSDGSGASG